MEEVEEVEMADAGVVVNSEGGHDRNTNASKLREGQRDGGAERGKEAPSR